MYVGLSAATTQIAERPGPQCRPGHLVRSVTHDSSGDIRDRGRQAGRGQGSRSAEHRGFSGRVVLTATLRDEGTEYDTSVVVGRVGRAIRHCAEEERASMIVVGMSHRGTLAELVSPDHPELDLARHAVRPVVAVPSAWPVLQLLEPHGGVGRML